VLAVSGRGGGFVVRAGLPDRDVIGLAVDAPATVVLDARPGERLPATVSEIARSPSPATGTFEVELRLDPARAPGDLLAGLTAKVEIPRPVAAEGAVPLAAVLEGDGADGAVFTVDGDRARRVPVRIAFLMGDVAVLASGLEGVQAVVVDGASRLSDGSAVQVTP
jgi:multidrug efflux pump subunit AcrA (membrane-fusion protein)